MDRQDEGVANPLTLCKCHQLCIFSSTGCCGGIRLNVSCQVNGLELREEKRGFFEAKSFADGVAWVFKGIGHPKLKLRPHVTHQYADQGSGDLFLFHVTQMEIIPPNGCLWWP